MKQTSTIRSSVLYNILCHIDISLDEQENLLSKFGLNTEHIANGFNTLPLRTYIQILEKLANLKNDPFFALNLSQKMGPDMIGPIGYVFLASPNLGVALRKFSHRVVDIQQATSFDVLEKEDVHLRYNIVDETILPRRQDAEFSIGFVFNLIQKYLGRSFAPKEIHFDHKKHSPQIDYEQFFKCPVYFEQNFNALIIHKSDLNRGEAVIDPALIPILEHYMDWSSELAIQPQNLTENVNQLLSNSLSPEKVKVKHIAGRLGIGVNTLNRRLSNEGTTFRQILRRKRIAVAKRYLKDTHLNILEIAIKIGYSETAAFTRAFKSETGITPKQYRSASR